MKAGITTMEQTTENLKNFIEQHDFDINRRAFQTLYSAARGELSRIDIGKLSELFIKIQEDVVSNLKYVPDYYLFNNKSVTSITLPKETVYIGISSFAYSGIQDIEIPEDVNFIGKSAFFMSDLKNIVFSGPIETIGSEAFARTKIRKISISTPQLFVYRRAFSGCNKLTLIEINANHAMFADDIFKGCDNLLEVHLPRINSSDLRDVKSWLSEELWSKKQVIIYCKDKILIAGEKDD